MHDITRSGFIATSRQYRLPGIAGLLVECDFSVEDFASLEPAPGLPTNIAHAVPKRQAEFLAGRWCAWKAQEQLGLVQVEIGVGSNRAPVWPDTVRGSITHTGPAEPGGLSVACCALALAGDYRALGIDLENIMNKTMAEETSSLILDEQERALLSQQDASWPYLVTLVFSAKESLFKALYPAAGRYFDFLDAQLVAIDVEAGKFSVELKVALAPSLPAGFRVHGCFQTRDLRLLTVVSY